MAATRTSNHLGSVLPSASSWADLISFSHLHPLSPSASASSSPPSANLQSSKGSTISSASSSATPRARDGSVDYVSMPSSSTKQGSAMQHDCTQKCQGWISVQELLKSAQFSADKQFDSLLGRFSEDMTLLRTNEEKKFENAVYTLAEELEKEQDLRKMLEQENKKLHKYVLEAGKAIAKAEKAAMKAEKKLEKEKMARMQIEVLYAELARVIYQDKPEQEKIKIAEAKQNDGTEENHKSMRMRASRCKEKVEMKLSEEMMEFEQRCIAFGDLKLKLDMFLSLMKAPQSDSSLEHQGKSLKSGAESLQREMAKSMDLLEDLNGKLSSNADHDLAKGRSESGLYCSQGSHGSVDLYADEGRITSANEETGKEDNDVGRLSDNALGNVGNVDEGQAQDENALSGLSQRMYELSKRLDEDEQCESKVEWSLPEHEVRKLRRNYLRNGVSDCFFSQDHLSRETNNNQATSSPDVDKGCFIDSLEMVNRYGALEGRKASRKSSSIWSKATRRNSLQAIEDELNDLDLNLEHLTWREFKK